MGAGHPYQQLGAKRFLGDSANALFRVARRAQSGTEQDPNWCAAELSIVNGRPNIHRVTVTVHCGLAVNPLTVESQFQGGIGFGLTQVMPLGAITLKEGSVEQGNFDRYTPPYIADAPTEIDLHIVDTTEPPTGV